MAGWIALLVVIIAVTPSLIRSFKRKSADATRRDGGDGGSAAAAGDSGWDHHDHGHSDCDGDGGSGDGGGGGD